MGKLTESMTGRDYFNIDDGHEMKMMAPMKPGPRGSSGANHTGSPETYKGSALGNGAESAGQSVGDIEGKGIGDMPMRTVGSMAENAYGADLRPDAINRIETFNADSDDSSIHRLMPRNGSDILEPGY